MALFEKGNPGGPGGARPGAGRKPNVAREAAERSLAGITAEDMAVIVAKAVEQAKEGDPKARAFLFERAMGRMQTPDLLAVEERMQAEYERFVAAVMSVLSEVQPEATMKVRETLEELGKGDDAASEEGCDAG